MESDEAAPDFLAEVKKVGGIVEFGHYEQDNNLENGSEPIEWIVLDVRDGKSLLISRYGLNCKPYNEKKVSVTWKTSSLRQWLYKDFYNEVFTALEQEAVLVTDVDNSRKQGNQEWSTDGGTNSQDRIFLLSYAEAESYFASDNARICKSTEYANEKGAYTNNAGICWWWLRSPGYNQQYAADVYPTGELGNDRIVSNNTISVRPALWISHDKYTEVLDEEAAAEHQRRLQIATQKLREELTSGDSVLVTFGAYEQDNDLENGPEPIEWIVLDVQDGSALLISKYGLDCQPYNTTRKTVTWETCSLRAWLNGDFLNSAFSDDETKLILETTVDNSKITIGSKFGWNTDWQPDTKDKVFLLSYKEAKEYFASNEERICQPTAYALVQGAYAYKESCWWWLRSIRTGRYYQGEAAYVNTDGRIGNSHNVDYNNGAVRPAMWIDLTPDNLT